MEKVPESKRIARFIPKLQNNPNLFAGSNLKHGGPLYIPTNKDYGNFRSDVNLIEFKKSLQETSSQPSLI